ncbi:CRISPR-associated helicase Cas3' [Gelidibacter japonicus]|uniref:CRISPR-associated helicase Cas3' n=1 Tax=Gelidibacter japonicus TaxID=1962232 RepID=UPI0013D6735A|nr:CRISPR-associated helicase Cas3' [Gelidibacter japonicus]
MIFYSHSKKDEKEQVFGSKELKTHILGVKEKALFHLADNVELGFSAEEIKELVKIITNLHDLGKYTSYFQNYLLKVEPINQSLKQHARIGGFTAFNLLENEDKKALLAFYLIFLHHSQLTNFFEVVTNLGMELNDIINSQKENLTPYFKDIENDIGIDGLRENIFYTDERKIRRGFRVWQKKQANIQDYFLINYLFSLLIEGDKLDASDTFPYTLQSILPDAVDKRFGSVSAKNLNIQDLDDSELRNYCRAIVTSHLEDNFILNQFIFTLTAPTGIGKTMTALDFSLKLKDKIKKEHNIESRIIYALPFINIIEQALVEYEKTLETENIKILGHYQYADIFGQDKENGNGEIYDYNQKLMALDTWQADIVITSFVQFFQTLIGNRNKLLKKFNHFANSIIILDEVQTLRLDQIPLLGASLYYLSKFLKARVILMTATRPKIFELAEQEILSNLGEKVDSKELLTTYEEVFARFKRTAVYPLLEEVFDEQEDTIENFISNIFDKKWEANKSCLIVCNTVNLSIELHSAIRKHLGENSLVNPIHYLSTNIIPAHRFNRIKNIKKQLEAGQSPILIATQVVEAGVDLDFDMGFRDIGPIDSIVQVAGRINRNNNPKKKHAPLYIVDFDSKKTIRIYGLLAYLQAKKALEQQDFFKEEEYLKLIETYFSSISEKSSFRDSRKFFESLQTLNYDNEDKTTYPISAFRIIEESDQYTSVFIEVDTKAREVRDKYLQKIRGELSIEEFNRDWKLQFQQHIISVPKYLCQDLYLINEYEENILIVPHEEIVSRYITETGYNRGKQKDNRSFVF